MREELRDPLRIKHMIEAIGNVNEFLHNKTQDDFKNDKLMFFAVVKNIEIIGEAAYKLTNEFKANHPETPWRVIIDMRHILVHGYYMMSHEMIYDVYINDLPILLKQLNQYKSEFNK